MSMKRFMAGVTELGEREVGIIAATDQLARDGHILEPSGISLLNYRTNPIVLFEHNPSQPVGACTAIAVEGRQLCARVEFAPAGASATADEICSLVKAGVVRGVSVGFDPIDMEPLDSRQGTRGGMRILSSELLEISFVSVPADTGASVVARGHRSVPGAARLLRSLPAIGGGAVARALGQIGRPSESQKPFGLLPAHEQMALIQRARTAHAMTTWGLQRAEREREDDYAERQARLRALSPESTH
jgi:uncharacterized protein